MKKSAFIFLLVVINHFILSQSLDSFVDYSNSCIYYKSRKILTFEDRKKFFKVLISDSFVSNRICYDRFDTSRSVSNHSWTSSGGCYAIRKLYFTDSAKRLDNFIFRVYLDTLDNFQCDVSFIERDGNSFTRRFKLVKIRKNSYKTLSKWERENNFRDEYWRFKRLRKYSNYAWIQMKN